MLNSNAPIFQNVLVVHELYANGLAVKDARLRPGDQIIRVNNAPLIGVPFLEAMNLIYSESNKAILQSTTQPDLDESPDNPKNEEGIPLGKPVLQLEVRRPKTNQSKWYDQEVTVELSKKSGKGLGICIADRCVYSSEPTAPAANGLIGSNGTSGNATSVHKNPSYGVIITDLVNFPLLLILPLSLKSHRWPHLLPSLNV